jgi:hypothetical protein
MHQSTGIPELDNVLGGGYPSGALTIISTGLSTTRAEGYTLLLDYALADDERCVLVNNNPDRVTLARSFLDAPEILFVNGWDRDGELCRTAIPTLRAYAPLTALVVLIHTVGAPLALNYEAEIHIQVNRLYDQLHLKSLKFRDGPQFEIPLWG